MSLFDLNDEPEEKKTKSKRRRSRKDEPGRDESGRNASDRKESDKNESTENESGKKEPRKGEEIDFPFGPDTDGIDHINIYSRARTELGRYLSNFALSPVMTEDGGFKSIEGYWYWLTSRNDNLRELHGFRAKEEGDRSEHIYDIPEMELRRKIREACWTKIHADRRYLAMFRSSALPFTHYYVFNGFVKPAGGDWLLDMWDYFRYYIRNGYRD